MRNWLQHSIEGSTYQGLEIFEIEDNTYYSLIKVKKRKGELNTIFEKAFNEIETVALHIQQRQPLFLVINSAKVLKKQIYSNSELNMDQRVMEAFPNLELDNFYYEIMEKKGVQVVSLCKKEYVESIIDELQSHNIVPYTVSLGISALENSLVHLQTETIVGSNFKLVVNNESEFKYEPILTLQQDTLNLNGLRLSNASLLSFSGIITHLSGQKTESNISKIHEPLIHGFKNKVIFDVGFKLGLGVILVTLLVNFLLFSYYRSKTQSLESISGSGYQLEMLKSIKHRVTSKEERVNKVINAGSSRSMFYCDRIASLMPKSIKLDFMRYQPLMKPIREEKPIELNDNSIQISGISNDKDEFAQWTEILEDQDWIRKIEIENYIYESKRTDKFSLNIEINVVGE